MAGALGVVMRFVLCVVAGAGAAMLLGSSGAAAQQFQVSAYGGYQTAPHSGVNITDGTQFTTGWDGKSFANPIYYGVRGTWWLDGLGLPNAGLSIDFSHTKVYSDPGSWPASEGFTHFEFTDGLNLLTANAFYRFSTEDQFRPYVGVGAGISIPHVELTRSSGTTSEYQYGGATVQLTAGFDYMLTENWSVFAEYKGNFSMVDVAVDSGDRLSSDIITNALNFGVSFHF
jgi:lipid A oxidase